VTVSASQAPTWHVTYANGQTGGPFTEDEVRAMIARQEIKIADSVAVTGSQIWVPITQSPFGSHILGQTNMERLASSTCPQCGAAMIVVLRRSTLSKILIYGGILTVWAFGFGFILIIVGLIVGRNKIPAYQCPRCKYKSK